MFYVWIYDFMNWWIGKLKISLFILICVWWITNAGKLFVQYSNQDCSFVYPKWRWYATLMCKFTYTKYSHRVLLQSSRQENAHSSFRVFEVNCHPPIEKVRATAMSTSEPLRATSPATLDQSDDHKRRCFTLMKIQRLYAWAKRIHNLHLAWIKCIRRFSLFSIFNKTRSDLHRVYLLLKGEKLGYVPFATLKCAETSIKIEVKTNC